MTTAASFPALPNTLDDLTHAELDELVADQADAYGAPSAAGLSKTLAGSLG